MDIYICEVICGMGDVKCLKDSIRNAGNVCGRVSVEEESLYQDTTVSSELMEDGSIVLCLRFVSKMLMRVVPGARGTRTFLVIVRFLKV